jgi:hypothetical protein
MKETRAASGARTYEMQMLIASVHERQFLEVSVPADGTNAAN